MFADIDELKLWALASGHSIAQCPGLEADDCIAALTQDWSGQSIIVSSDHDFKKLLQDNRVWLCRDSTKGVLYTHDDLEKELGITPAQYLLVGVLTGDPSDNVKGVPGVGPKTAIKLLRRHEWNIFAVMQDPKVAPHADAVARNFELIGWREPHGPWLVEGEFNDDVLIDIFERWEFNSMLEGLRERQA
jgi:5'-3' exonuclease